MPVTALNARDTKENTENLNSSGGGVGWAGRQTEDVIIKKIVEQRKRSAGGDSVSAGEAAMRGGEAVSVR